MPIGIDSMILPMDNESKPIVTHNLIASSRSFGARARRDFNITNIYVFWFSDAVKIDVLSICRGRQKAKICRYVGSLDPHHICSTIFWHSCMLHVCCIWTTVAFYDLINNTDARKVEFIYCSSFTCVSTTWSCGSNWVEDTKTKNDSTPIHNESVYSI